jgi:hypothetical protein
LTMNKEEVLLPPIILIRKFLRNERKPVIPFSGNIHTLPSYAD